MANEKESNAMFWGFVLGAIGGAAFALLRTPRSGREIRGEITSQASRLTSRGQQSMDYAWQPASSVQQKAAGMATDVQKQAGEAVDVVADAASTASETLQEQVSDAADAAQNVASDSAEALQQQAADAAGAASDALDDAADKLASD